MTLQPHQQRVRNEQTDLEEKHEALGEFLLSPKFTTIVPDVAERGRLLRQHTIMGMYLAVLAERIAAF